MNNNDKKDPLSHCDKKHSFIYISEKDVETFTKRVAGAMAIAALAGGCLATTLLLLFFVICRKFGF